MWVCYGAVHFSLWSVSHIKIALIINEFLKILYITNILLVHFVRTNICTTWVFYSSPFALFCCPFLPNPLMCPPKPSFFTHSPNRGQYSAAHLYRFQLQNSHQWYVRIKLSALSCSFPQPVNGPQYTVQWKWQWWTVTYKMSLTLLTQCMTMCVPLSLFPLVLFLCVICFWKCVWLS